MPPKQIDAPLQEVALEIPSPRSFTDVRSISAPARNGASADIIADEAAAVAKSCQGRRLLRIAGMLKAGGNMVSALGVGFWSRPNHGDAAECTVESHHHIPPRIMFNHD